MSGSSTTFVAARFLTPDYLVRGRDNVISCPLWSGASLVAPTQSGSTVSVYDGNTAVVDAAAVTVTGSIATYTVPASVLSVDRALARGWRVEWSLVLSGVARPFSNTAALVRSELAPMIADADLFRRESSLNPSGSAPISSFTTFQDFRDEAWITLHGLLAAKGSLVHLIMEPSALREPMLTLTLALIFADFRTRLSEVHGEKARDYRQQFERAMADLRFEYDSAQSGQADAKRRGASATVFMCGRG